MRPRERRRPKQTPPKPRTFLVRPVHQADRHRRPARILLIQRTQHLKSTQHPEASIQPPAVRHRIEMPPQQQRPLARTTQRHPMVSRRIVMPLDAFLVRQRIHQPLKPRPSLQPHWRPRHPLRALLIGRQRAQHCQFRAQTPRSQPSRPFPARHRSHSLAAPRPGTMDGGPTRT